MKNLFILSLLLIGVFFASCEKDDDKLALENFKFEATVLSTGMDCGDTFIISLKNLESNSDIKDGIYYADNLASAHKVQGLMLYLNCRVPNDGEFYACTTMGPTYPHVFVIKSAKVDN